MSSNVLAPHIQVEGGAPCDAPVWAGSDGGPPGPHFVSRGIPDPADEGRVVGNCASTMLVDCDLRHEAGKPALTLVELAAKLQGSIYDSVEHSTYTAGVDVMQDLNQRDKTPGRAVAPYVFASVLGGEGKDSTPNPFAWSGKTPLRSSLTTPNVW